MMYDVSALMTVLFSELQMHVTGATLTAIIGGGGVQVGVVRW